MNKPYVVSADIKLLMEKWATKNNFVLPSGEFFCQLREEFSDHLCRIFSNFEFVSEYEISLGIADLVATIGLPVISLDRVYFESELNLEIARLVNENGENQGLGHRPGTPSLLQQINRLRAIGSCEVTLVDDVIFSGALLERIIEILSKIGIQVPVVCAGIGIAEGIHRINTKRDIRCVRTYEEVIDEVCERDFYPGVPLSGRPLAGDGNIGVPYILPFGNPKSWASIPNEHVETFSKFCLHQTVTLFKKIEQCSERQVLCQNLGRKVLGLPTDETRFIDVLSVI